jgi:ion channel-forming bestrophin family protein
MIVDKRLHLGLLARFNLPTLSALVAYDIVVTFAYCVLDWHFVSRPSLPLALLGSAIALIVTIRNNAAYGRWWEARTLWGSIVNNSRSLARGLVTFAGDGEFSHGLIRRQIAYVLALRCHLLRQPVDAALERYLPGETAAACRAASNPPLAIHLSIGRELASAGAARAIDSVSAAALDRTLAAISDAQGGLERIKNTPLPRQYSLLPLVFIRVYCLILPLGVVANLGLATPLGSGLIGFMFLVLDEVGRDLEDPFEDRVYDVPMAAITRTVEIDLLQAIGAADIPEAIKPRNGILM